jgi:signal transduction histidine kinase
MHPAGQLVRQLTHGAGCRRTHGTWHAKRILTRHSACLKSTLAGLPERPLPRRGLQTWLGLRAGDIDQPAPENLPVTGKQGRVVDVLRRGARPDTCRRPRSLIVEPGAAAAPDGGWTSLGGANPGGDAGLPPGGLSAERSHVQAELPWNVLVTSTDTAGDQGLALRWRLLTTGFLLLVTIAVVASALVLRTVSREMAVARLQSDFVAAVSHEFRTPLTTLRQFTEMLREQPHLDQERRALCYDTQARATDRLTRLVESVLDFGRIEAGAQPYRFELQDGVALVRRVVDDFRGEPQASDWTIAYSGDGAAPLTCDPDALARAVWNLLDNALKYSRPGTCIDVAVRARGGAVRIAVQDRGLGIAPHEQRAIFAKFQRGDEARLRGIRGTGLGLAMVHQIVRAHSGHVDVESAPGAGSTFTIVLPAPAACAAHIEAHSAPSSL